MNQAVIDIQGITKTYVNGKLSVPVLHGIDLQVNKGEFVSIMGPSAQVNQPFEYSWMFGPTYNWFLSTQWTRLLPYLMMSLRMYVLNRSVLYFKALIC
ncbi:MAG: hypothetical protein ACLRZ2_01655 [Veillonella sp.]